MTYLLDANVAIALVVKEHEHHGAASSWFTGVDRVALCPIVEGALMRFLIRIGESAETAFLLLQTLRDHPRMTFFPDSISYEEVRFADILGYRQLTDVYLAELARRNGGLLATFDRGLHALRPESTHLLILAG